MSPSTSPPAPTARLIPFSPASAREEGACILHTSAQGLAVSLNFPNHAQAREWCKENGFDVHESLWARRLRGVA